jgi:predicted GNAT family N-acyltransferase
MKITEVKKWGHDLMREAITAIATRFNETKITIGAQLYLKNSMKVTALCKQVKCI